jgi:DNA-binding MltR family transcriptional regulator
MVWIIDKYDEETIKQIEHQGDRSAAILAAACLEDRLEHVMRDAMEPHKAIVDSMLKGYGPLASFKSKIDFCYVMGMCPEPAYKMMTRIKDVRNEFAHSPTAKTFVSQRISDLCANFPKIEKVPKGFKKTTRYERRIAPSYDRR